MEETRRRQLHSCDPCRKGKRRCDAPKNRKEEGFNICSNCMRWKKECTFKWVTSKRVESTESRRKAKVLGAGKPRNQENSSFEASNSLPNVSQWHSIDFDDALTPSDASNFAFSFPSQSQDLSFDGSNGTNSSSDQSDLFSWGMDIPIGWQTGTVNAGSERRLIGLDPQPDISNAAMNALDGPFNIEEQNDDEDSPFSFPSVVPSYNQVGPGYSSASRIKGLSSPSNFCISSEKTASEYARSTMTRNLIRIYHDSMENALSCWLTEHNCPYSDSISTILPTGERKEWGPNWSNRMCIRVCQLDHVSSSIRGRPLSPQEDKTASRVLHLAIIAFASQWTQHAQKGAVLSVPEPISRDERSIREYVWNEARHGLEHSTRIPSFRIIFANIVFSLTQSPLDQAQDRGLAHLLENDGAPTFLETANRQLFTFRHKFVRLTRGNPTRVTDIQNAANHSSLPGESELSNAGGSIKSDPLLSSQEHRSTLGLLFWLGVMFDTLSAAIYQRPLVVSDEDSQIASASPIASHAHNQLSLSGPPRNQVRRKKDVWDDFFLYPSVQRGEISNSHFRWPCSYEEAAAILSEATPVKVLLYRRVTQLQTLVYRGASCDKLEDIIQKTLSVYQHWNFTYQRFMLDCVQNHELLPSRIQSWYVILDGHWHLATMLLADTIEGIDKGKLGLESEREARSSANFVSTLRTEHAFAVGELARASLQGQNPSMYHNFHESLNEVAFLVEPWTVVLTHSFAKAAQISIESLDLPGERSVLSDSFRQNCQFCIGALQYLGRKSDMAFMVARNLSGSLNSKLLQII